MADEYGAPESLDYLSDPNFKGYVTPTFGNVHEFAAWMEASPHQTPESRRLIQAIRTNPHEFEIHGGHFRPKPSFMAKWWPVIVVAAAVAAPAVAGALTGGGGAAGTTAATSGTLANTAGTGSAVFNAATTAVPATVASQAASAGAASTLIPNLAGPGSSVFNAATQSTPPSIASQAASTRVPTVPAPTGGPQTPPRPNPLNDPNRIAQVAGLIPAFQNLFSGGGEGAFGANSDLMKGINEDMGAARKRYQQAGPIYDALINMAYGRTPTQYRGAAPAGYSGDRAPEGGYAFTPPRFG